MFKDRIFFQSLFTIALPLILESFTHSSLNLVGGIMIGQLGDVPVAAVGLANQVFFVLLMVLFGVTSGCAIFTAQYWGKKDIANIRRVLGICLMMSLSTGLLFFAISITIPNTVIGIYSRDPNVIALGGQFLRIMSPSFLMMAFSFAYAAILRSTGDVRTPLISSLCGLSVGTLSSYVLIFGKAGFPAMGANGAAVGILIGRFLETVVILGMVYGRRLVAAAKMSELLDFDRTFLRWVASRSLPVALNETFWSLGVTTYSIVYARISTEALAAMNITVTIEQIGFVIFIGIADATAILVGNKIGAGETETAYRYAGWSLVLAMVGAIGIGFGLMAASSFIIGFYQVSPGVAETARRVLIVVAFTMWVRVSNMTLIVGILRSGGDTRFSFILDSSTVWLVGVPLAFLGAFTFKLPVYWVYLLILSEEFVKMGVCLYRYLSRKWINDLTQVVAV